MSQSIIAALESIEDILQRLPDYAAKKQAILERLQEERLRVLVYGAYNAGKSTLINALLADQRAAVGEIPTTNRISRYEWQDILLLDSPGLNAPIQHEQISRAEILASDLILFVIRQDDEDSAAVYQELMRLLKANRSLFILYNYSGLDPQSSGENSVYRAIHHLNQILLKQAQQAGISDQQLKQIELIAVNLRTAFKARLQGQAELLEYSGFNEFTRRFQQWLDQYPAAELRLKQIKKQIEHQLIEPARALFDDHLSADLKKLYQQLDFMQQQKQSLLADLRLFVQSEIEGLSHRVVNLLQNEQSAQAEAEIKASYQRIQQRLRSSTQCHIDLEQPRFRLRLDPLDEEGEEEDEDFQFSKIIPSLLSLPTKYPWIGIAITVLTSLFGDDDEETEQENERRRQRALQIAQIAQQVRSGIIASLWPQIEQAVQANYQPQLDALQQQIEEQQTHLQAQQTQLARLEQAYQQIKEA